MSVTHRHPGWTDGSRTLSQIDPFSDDHGTPGNDRIKGGAADDYIDVSQGGNDKIGGGFGDDTVYFGAAFTGADRVTGGAGVDTVILDGDYSAGVAVQADSFAKVERLVLEGGSYVLTGEIASAQGTTPLLIDAYALTADQTLNFNVESSGDLGVVGGAGDDVMRASSQTGTVTLAGFGGDDTLIGGEGDAILCGGMGADRIEMNGSGNIAQYFGLDSTAEAFDTIVNFAESDGKIWFLFDSDTSTPAMDHDFHLGKTADRTGDILFKYDAGKDETVVKVFTDPDHTADFVLHLTGDVPLTHADFIFG